VVVKDYAQKPFVFRVTVGIFSCWREACIYEKLQGIQGILKCFGRLDRYAILIAYMPGKNAKEASAEALTPLFFKKMRAVIDAVHARGIVLCDLRNIKNTIVGEDGEPYLIDFPTAFLKGGRFSFFRNGIFKLFFQDDLLSIPKIKRRRVPQLMSESERLALEKGIFIEKQAKFIKVRGRSFLRWIFGLGKSHRKNRGREKPDRGRFGK